MGLRVITRQGTVLSSTGLAEEGIALAEPADQRRALGLAFAVCSAEVLMGQSFLMGKPAATSPHPSDPLGDESCSSQQPPSL